MATTLKIDVSPQACTAPLDLPVTTQGWQAALNVAQSTGRPVPNIAANEPHGPAQTAVTQVNPRVGLTKGTMIETLDGAVKVEDLKPRDMLRTAKGTYRPLRHIFHITPETPRPAIRINAGALGPDLPATNLRLPKDQQVLATSEIAQKLFGENGFLVSARLLTALPGVTAARSKVEALYILLLDEQDTVLAGGVPVETLAPCAANLDLVPPHLREAMTRLFPSFGESSPEAAQRLKAPKPKRQKRLVHRHVKTGVTLLGNTPDMPAARTA